MNHSNFITVMTVISLFPLNKNLARVKNIAPSLLALNGRSPRDESDTPTTPSLLTLHKHSWRDATV